MSLGKELLDKALSLGKELPLSEGLSLGKGLLEEALPLMIVSIGVDDVKELSIIVDVVNTTDTKV